MSEGGFTVWLYGPPAAGKTTLAEPLAQALAAAGLACRVLDSRILREEFWPELGHGPDDGRQATLRTARLAAMLAAHGVCPVVAQTAPHAADRLEARRILGEVVEVYLDCPLEQLINRDPHGLYAAALEGRVKGLSGFDAPYEPPEDPDVLCPTHLQSPAESLAAILAYLLEAGLLSQAPPAAPDGAPAYTPEQEAIIRRRLADLGYL